MKHNAKLVTYLFALLSITLFFGCSQSSKEDLAEARANAVVKQQDVKAAVADQTEAAKRVEWLDFKNNAEVTILANEKIITEYKERMSDEKGVRRAQFDKKINALELKNKELKAKLLIYPEGGKSTWEQFMIEFSHDMDELGTALKDFTVNNNK